MCTHTPPPNPLCWIFISGNNIPLNNFIFQYRDSYKCAMSDHLSADTRKPDENLEDWMKT